eukprot:3234381-Prymnesium_polylepis.1
MADRKGGAIVGVVRVISACGGSAGTAFRRYTCARSGGSLREPDGSRAHDGASWRATVLPTRREGVARPPCSSDVRASASSRAAEARPSRLRPDGATHPPAHTAEHGSDCRSLLAPATWGRATTLATTPESSTPEGTAFSASAMVSSADVVELPRLKPERRAHLHSWWADVWPMADVVARG